MCTLDIEKSTFIVQFTVWNTEIFEEGPYLLIRPVDDRIDSDEIWKAFVHIAER